MKKMMIALTALALQSSFADTVRTFQSPSQWECTYISSGNVCKIFGYGGVNPGTSVTFPSSVYDAGVAKTYTVNQLGDATDPVFTNQQGNVTQKITSITVPSTVSQINSYAFSNLQFLTVANTGSATIMPNALPGSMVALTAAGDLADSACEGQPKLRSVTLQDGVRSIGSKAFKNCKSLTSLSIPKTVTYIAPDAFEGSGIKYVVLQRGNVSLKSFPKGIYATVQLLPYPKK
jgi:hypothetical protein